MGIFFSKCFKLDIKFECTLCGERSLTESSTHNEERSKHCFFIKNSCRMKLQDNVLIDKYFGCFP